MSSRMVRVIGTGAFVLIAGASLTACGSDDSSATSTPSFTSSSAAATSSAPTSAASSSAAATTTSGAASTSPGAAATAPEQAEPVPSGFPGPTETSVDARGQAFLDELKAKGVTVAGDGEIAISTANYICAAQQQGVPADQISTFVTANVGSEAAATGAEITPEQAGATAQTYVAAAVAKYCS